MSKNKNINIIGHRGAAGLEFENTIRGILRAIKLGVYCIEIDVRETLDNEIVVFHDRYLDRLTSESGFINEMSFEKINSIKLNNGDGIPSLKEVVEIVKKHKVQLLVEIKTDNAFSKALAILTENLSYSEFIIGSFFHKDIMDIKKQNSLIQTSVMFESVPVSLDQYLTTVNPNFVIVSIETYNQYLVDIVKSQNRKLAFYTVNTEPEIELVSKALPFAIITDYPDIFLDSTTQ